MDGRKKGNHRLDTLWHCPNLKCIILPQNSGKCCEPTCVAGKNESEEFLAVIIPEGTKIIPQKAFYNCQNLLYVYVPDSVECIQGGAFANCWNLLEVSLPKGVTIVKKTHDCPFDFEWEPFEEGDNEEEEDDISLNTFENEECLKYREHPLSPEEWLATLMGYL